ncbi:MAG: crosslink repair DNA glycosylase YcaQ family protein [Acidimicrobiales bacterium]|nr:crosslink repair DNA glycosylase YcaQ family protein [Acidimicrobiales bacterium]
MSLSSGTLRLAEARRIALQAQGFGDPRPSGRVDRRHFRRVLRRVGLVQIDSVNVVTRSHELPFLARLGPYPRAALAEWLWDSGEVFEYWGHEASLLPVDLHPLLRWRMLRDEGHAWSGVRSFLDSHPGLDQQILAAVAERGPVPLGQLDHLGAAIKRTKPAPGNMWNWTPAKKAVEWLFWRGEVSAVRNPQTFERSYVLPERILPAAVLEAPTVPTDAAHKELLLRAARSHGVGSARCLADYHRLNIVESRRLLAELVTDGALRQVSIEGWRQPAFLHPDATLPRWVRSSALLSPFDSLVWERDRTEALFGFRYRIEIYVPAADRVHGYYVLPFLHDGRLVARVDLKADRQAGALLVRGAFAEHGIDLDEVAAPLHDRLAELAGFLGLAELRVEPGARGDLGPALATAG